MESMFETYYKQLDAEEADSDLVSVRITEPDGKSVIKNLTPEQVELLWEAGADVVVVQMDEDGGVEEFKV